MSQLYKSLRIITPLIIGAFFLCYLAHLNRHLVGDNSRLEQGHLALQLHRAVHMACIAVLAPLDSDWAVVGGNHTRGRKDVEVRLQHHLVGAVGAGHWAREEAPAPEDDSFDKALAGRIGLVERWHCAHCWHHLENRRSLRM